MEIETAMAKAFLSRTELRDPQKTYHIYTVADFQKLAPEFRVGDVLHGSRHRPLRHAECGHAGVLQGAEWTADGASRWMRGRAICAGTCCTGRRTNCPSRSSTRISPSSPARWRARRSPCRAGGSAPALPIGALGEAVGQDWVKQNFPPSSKAEHGQAGGRSRESARRRTSRRCRG